MEGKELPLVLYEDYNGLWCPLAELYWSNSSHVLVSRHPLSSIEELISAYCPHCLQRFMEEDTGNYQNKCPACYLCPVCSGALVVASLPLAPGKLALTCNSCFYRSDCCGIVGSDKPEIDACVLERERENSGIDAFTKIQNQLQTWDGGRLIEDQQHTISANSPHASSFSNISSRSDSEFLDAHQIALTLWQNQPTLLACSLPPRVRLRSKRTLRCRLDVEASKMSILAQPKTFPLEGDSSLKIQRGKWWVKDSSAIHDIPRLVLIRLPDDELLKKGEIDFLHFELSNPKDAPAKLTLSCVITESTLLPNMPPQEDNSQMYTATLGAFEDELLRESESVDTEASEQLTTQLNNAQQQSDQRSSMRWLVATAYNNAAFIVPVRMAPNVNAKDSPTIVFEMGLNEQHFKIKCVLPKTS